MALAERISAGVTFPWLGRQSCLSVPLLLLLSSATVATPHAFSQAPPAPASCPLLLPIPRECAPDGTVSLAHGLSITPGPDAEDRFAARDFSAWLRQLNVPSRETSSFHVELLRTSTARGLLARAGVRMDPAMHDEGYAILPAAHGIAVVADTPAGTFYGVQTLKQLISGSGPAATLNLARIRDWPAMRYRGVSDDLSRGPIPTLEFEEREIRTLAAYKVNLYSPYFESTLQYQFNPLPALPGGSLTQAEARALVEYARHYHVMVVPEQEAFGHLHHVLTYEQYAPLAETPLGSVLAPGRPVQGQEGSIDLIALWFREIAQIFPAPFLHVGADETADLGRGRTSSAVAAQGLGATYVDFLIRIHARLAPLNRRLLFWGDVAMSDPGEVKRLPRDMIAVAWTYNPSPSGYQRWLQPYVAAGMETWVAPGINNWKRVYPDNFYALSNIQGFVRDGHAAHSTGMLNTLWNDDGEGLFLEDWYGLLFGAAAAWQPGTSSVEKFQASYGLAFHGDATGSIDEAQQQLISIYRLLDPSPVKQTTDVLFWMDPWSADGQITAAKLRPMLPAIRLSAERAITLIAQARNAGPLRETDALDALELGARRLDFIGQKFETADEIAKLYQEAYSSRTDSEKSKEVLRALQIISGANGLCQDMRDGYGFSRTQYSSLWLRENRPYWLDNVQARYDRAMQLWIGRSESFDSAIESWHEHRTLPSPQELGIPEIGIPEPKSAEPGSAKPDTAKPGIAKPGIPAGAAP